MAIFKRFSLYSGNSEDKYKFQIAFHLFSAESLQKQRAKGANISGMMIFYNPSQWRHLGYQIQKEISRLFEFLNPMNKH